MLKQIKIEMTSRIDNIIPIFKNIDNTQFTNYRSISLFRVIWYQPYCLFHRETKYSTVFVELNTEHLTLLVVSSVIRQLQHTCVTTSPGFPNTISNAVVLS